MIGQGLYWGVTVGVPVAPRCTPLVTAASGMDLARAVARGLDLHSTPVPHCPGDPTPREDRCVRGSRRRR
jgi:hypothetical protein